MNTAGVAVHTRHVIVALFLVTTLLARDDHAPIVSNAATAGAEVGKEIGTRWSISPAETMSSPACKSVIGNASDYLHGGQSMTIQNVQQQRARFQKHISLNAWCKYLHVGYVKIPKGDSKGHSTSLAHADHQHDAFEMICVEGRLSLLVRLTAWEQESGKTSKTCARGR